MAGRRSKRFELLKKSQKNLILNELHEDASSLLKKINKKKKSCVDDCVDEDWHFAQFLDYVRMDIENFLKNTDTGQGNKMEKILKAYIAKRRIKKAKENDEYDVDLRGYTEMDDDAAKVLAECDKAIDLRDLVSLTDKAAEYFSSHKHSIDLAKVFDLTYESAKWLSQKQSFIHFEMPTISDENAQAFSKGVAKLKMTGLRVLNGSDAHLAFVRYLAETRMIGRMCALKEVDPKILEEFPELKK
jgi:hypothetical protein